MSQVQNLFQRLGLAIVAPATALGGPVCVLRVSGENLEFLKKLFKENTFPEAGTFALRNVVNASGIILDRALVLNFKSPNSFTGEDVLEIHCHGVSSTIEKITESLSSLGVRKALPGEFSFRAVFHKKMTLAEAESLNAALSLESLESESAAELLLGGRNSPSAKTNEIFSATLKEVQQTRGLLEAAIDFPEAAMEQQEFIDTVEQKIVSLEKKFTELKTAFENFSLKAQEPRVLIFGKPNVGKSTLFNLLIGGDRALVSEIAGTTRDVLEARIKLPHLGWIRILDTAGIRESKDKIELLGIEKGRQYGSLSKMGIYIRSAKDRTSTEDADVLEWKKAFHENDSLLEIFTFKDLKNPQQASDSDFELVQEPALSKSEILNLIETRLLESKVSTQKGFFMPARQIEIVEGALAMLGTIKSEIKNEVPLEVVADTFKQLEALLKNATNQDLGEEYISAIFSQFCLGK